MGPDLLGEFLYLARFSLVSWLFTIAGVIMVVSRPRWPGSWWLLAGAIISSALVGARLLGFVPRDASVWVWIAYEALETLGFVLTGVGVLMVSVRQRRQASVSPDVVSPA
jgi:hypothetical protein